MKPATNECNLGRIDKAPTTWIGIANVSMLFLVRLKQGNKKNEKCCLACNILACTISARRNQNLEMPRYDKPHTGISHTTQIGTCFDPPSRISLDGQVRTRNFCLISHLHLGSHTYIWRVTRNVMWLRRQVLASLQLTYTLICARWSSLSLKRGAYPQKGAYSCKFVPIKSQNEQTSPRKNIGVSPMLEH